MASGVNNIDETYSTLKFAERAKNVPLTVEANKIMATDQELYKKLIREVFINLLLLFIDRLFKKYAKFKTKRIKCKRYTFQDA